MTLEAELSRKTRRAWTRSPPPGRGVGSPSPGDVVVLEYTAAYDVEWAVLALDSTWPARLLMVVADGRPLKGSADVEVSASAAGGPLVLRCQFGGWVDAELLAGATRTATLTQHDVARARDRRAKVEDASVVGSILACEVDDDPEYQDWVAQVLAPAWQAIAALAGEEDDAVEYPGWVERVPAPVSDVAEGKVLVRELDRDSMRVAAAHVRLPSEVLMTLEKVKLGQKYGAELCDATTGKRQWAIKEVRQDLLEQRIGFSRVLLPPGEYLLRVLELTDGSSELIAECPWQIPDA